VMRGKPDYFRIDARLAVGAVDEHGVSTCYKGRYNTFLDEGRASARGLGSSARYTGLSRG
jgi:hypothetical protein